ncbi:MAG: hypothetical protein R3B96_18685 [Pirellulaceae bacterium]
MFIPGTDSGTFDYFAEVVAGKTGSIRNEGVSTDENDNSLVASVAGDRNAMGFFGAAYYFAHQDELRAVPIVNPAGDAVAPHSLDDRGRHLRSVWSTALHLCQRQQPRPFGSPEVRRLLHGQRGSSRE